MQKQFSKREWLFLIAILLMLEAWILGVSNSYKDQTDVINYISFASTIASLLLAVIAIIYGYYQSDGQQRSANAISAQIESLVNVQGTIESASKALQTQITEAGEIQQEIKQLSSAVESRFEAMTGSLGILQTGHAALLTSLQTFTGSAPKNLDSAKKIDNVRVVEGIFTQSSPVLDVLGAACFYALSASPNRSIHWAPFADSLGKNIFDGEFQMTDSQWVALLIAIPQVLIGFDFMRHMKNDGKPLLVISEDNLRVLEKAVKRAETGSVTAGIVKKIKEYDFGEVIA